MAYEDTQLFFSRCRQQIQDWCCILVTSVPPALKASTMLCSEDTHLCGAQSGDLANGDISSRLSSPCSMSHLFRWLCYSQALGLHLSCSENMLHANSHHLQKHFCRGRGSSPHELPNITQKPAPRQGENLLIPSLVCHFTLLQFKSSTTHLTPTLRSQFFFGSPV